MLVNAEQVSLSVDVLNVALDASKVTDVLTRLSVMLLATAVGAMLSATVTSAVVSVPEELPDASTAVNLYVVVPKSEQSTGMELKNSDPPALNAIVKVKAPAAVQLSDTVKKESGTSVAAPAASR